MAGWSLFYSGRIPGHFQPMSAYFQMGHDSENLVGQSGLDFAGIMLSPVNRSDAKLRGDVPGFRKKGTFDIVFDPQLYCPQH